MHEMEALQSRCLQCQNCRLASTRTKVVFGVGVVPSDIVFVGEGPGQQEDLQGEPFVGAAGKLLDGEREELLGARDDVVDEHLLRLGVRDALLEQGGIGHKAFSPSSVTSMLT